MLKKLDMVSIRVKDWRAAVDWYRDVLGLRPVGLHEDPWCLMTFPEGGAAIALDGTNPVLPGNNCIPNVQVEDLPKTIDVLRGRGVQFAREFEADEEEGYRIATIRDLEGNLINLYDYGPSDA